MSLFIRPSRRFPVCCDVPLRVGQSFPMTVTFLNQRNLFIAAGIVRWVRGDDYGVETFVADTPALNYMARYVR